MIRRPAPFAAALALAACATPAPHSTEPFGSAVRNMQYEQIHDLRAAQQPPADAPAVMDGQRAAQVLKAYREGDDAGAQPITMEPVLLQEP